VECRSPAN